MVFTASFVAIFISCLGVFGLAGLMLAQRTKEIGIRKVFGATIPDVIKLISTEFTVLVTVSAIIAIPAARYLMQQWLQSYPYRIEISWWVFLLASGLALVIAVLTVSTQAIRAALANPVESLRYE